MKNNTNIHQATLVAFCLFFFSFGLLSAQRWVPSETSKGLLPPAYSITCVRVVDSLTIWALASHDGFPRVDTFDLRILKTTNGGQTWEVMKYPSNLGHYGYVIDALDGTTALISAVTWDLGNGLQIAKTTDGGRTWTTTLPIFLPAYVHFFDRNNVAAVVPPQLANSTDGGTTWVENTTMFDPTINDGLVNLGNGTNSFAARGDTMWIGTQIGFLYRSIDKGQTFQTITSGISPDFYVVSIAFTDARNGMMTTIDSLYNLSIGTTKDGGTTWQFLPTIPDGFGSFALLSAIPNTGVFVLTSDGYDPALAGKSFVTTDMGKTWKPFKGRDVATRAHEFLSKNVGWAGSIEISGPSTAAMYRWEPSTLFTPNADFFTENFNRGLPTTWTTSANAPKFMPCDSTCLKDFDTRNSTGFYDYIKRLDDPSDAATINSTFKSGAMALKMHRNTNLTATLTSPAINCATKNKVYLQFSSIYWGGANADSVQA